MRLANYADRAHLVLKAADDTDRLIDIADASAGNFSPSLAMIYDVWDDLVGWAAAARHGSRARGAGTRAGAGASAGAWGAAP